MCPPLVTRSLPRWLRLPGCEPLTCKSPPCWRPYSRKSTSFPTLCSNTLLAFRPFTSRGPNENVSPQAGNIFVFLSFLLSPRYVILFSDHGQYSTSTPSGTPRLVCPTFSLSLGNPSVLVSILPPFSAPPFFLMTCYAGSRGRCGLRACLSPGCLEGSMWLDQTVFYLAGFPGLPTSLYSPDVPPTPQSY